MYKKCHLSILWLHQKKGPLFIKSIDGTKEYKDKHFIVDLFLKVIGEIGHQRVVQIITDNAFVMKAA